MDATSARMVTRVSCFLGWDGCQWASIGSEVWMVYNWHSSMQGWQSSVRNSTSAEQTTKIFQRRLVSSFDFTDEKVFRPSVRPSSGWTTVRSMLTLNKYELNRLDSSSTFKKYKKIRPMSSVFVLTLYNTMCRGIHMKASFGWHDSCDRVTGYAWKRPADDVIPVTESRESDIMWTKIYLFLWLLNYKLRSSRLFMCCKEILQTSGNSLPTRLQAIMQPGGRWQTPRAASLQSHQHMSWARAGKSTAQLESAQLVAMSNLAW